MDASGTGTVNPDAAMLAYEGTLRALAHFGHLSKRNKRLAIPPAPKQVRWVEILSRDYYVYAPQPGLFVKFDVERGGGLVHYADTDEVTVAPVTRERAGIAPDQQRADREASADT